jgi:hydroxypyruvate isomerase
MDDTAMEKVFREYATLLGLVTLVGDRKQISIDGKMVRKSFDHLNDRKALQVLGALLTQENIIIAHEMIDTKNGEIEAAQQLIKKLGLTNVVYTFDALHCQKKRCEL